MTIIEAYIDVLRKQGPAPSGMINRHQFEYYTKMILEADLKAINNLGASMDVNALKEVAGLLRSVNAKLKNLEYATVSDLGQEIS